MTHDEINAGADIIVMHGALLLHGEIYRGRPIFFDSATSFTTSGRDYIDELMALGERRFIIQFEADLRTRRNARLSDRQSISPALSPEQRSVMQRYRTRIPTCSVREAAHPGTGARAAGIPERLSNASSLRTTMEIRGETATIVATGR
jgi:hypothetical protein